MKSLTYSIFFAVGFLLISCNKKLGSYHSNDRQYNGQSITSLPDTFSIKKKDINKLFALEKGEKAAIQLSASKKTKGVVNMDYEKGGYSSVGFKFQNEENTVLTLFKNTDQVHGEIINREKDIVYVINNANGEGQAIKKPLTAILED